MTHPTVATSPRSAPSPNPPTSTAHARWAAPLRRLQGLAVALAATFTATPVALALAAAPPPPPPPAGDAPPPPPAATATAPTCSDPTGVCIDGPRGTQWKVGKRTPAKARKARGKGAPGTWTVQLDGGRASVFLDGRWVGEAPLRSAPIPAGSHDLEVRDGARVLARGELVVPKGATLDLVIHHPAPATE